MILFTTGGWACESVCVCVCLLGLLTAMYVCFCCLLCCSQLGDVTDTIIVAPGQTSTVQQLLKGVGIVVAAHAWVERHSSMSA